MFKQTLYVPILKGKQGELDAIEELTDAQKSRMAPLIEIPPIPWDFKKDEPEATVNEHPDSIGMKLRKAWDSDAPFFVDVGLIENGIQMADGSHPLTYVFRKARNQNLRPVPVTGVNRDSDYEQALAAVITDNSGACIRLTGDFEATTLRTQLDGCLTRLRLDRTNTDIIVDFGAILPNQASIIAAAADTTIRNLPYIDEWRTVVFAATAFPDSLSTVHSDSVGFLDRTEWRVWQGLHRSRQLPRIPIFGDYAIQYPVLPDNDPRLMTMTANIRYTATDRWLILRGHDLRRPPGYDQFISLCTTLVGRAEYCGEQHCAGDSYIKRCSEGRAGTGGLSDWRRVGSVHHLVRTIEMVATLS